MIRELFCVGLGGAIGCMARHALSTWMLGGHLLFGFPLGTFTVNVLGSFLFGFIWHLAAVRLLIPDHVRIILLVGFMGSFTTFSSLMFDSFALGQTRLVLLFFNIGAQVVLGMGALLLGMTLARQL